ncbi:hypothetical protein QAD02_014482 [Eretmocerus hayati]|uniref:Uncharacterized protein n=1 Tax=Eretmocerus hayati TaxID=131215 RepID=A0ACC2P5L8_9HYME|nr:hypothetical protein QAD02_014482 [Eretmocerus hayati]
MPEPAGAEQYSIWVGLIFVFNLIVGTGALALPFVFSQAGWLLGTTVVLILAFISYITVTFVIESIASANAIITWKKTQERRRALQASGDGGHANSDSEDTPLVTTSSENPDDNDESQRYYAIQQKVEMGEMASMFFNKIGITLFYVCLTTYLYGDLSIYGTAIAKSVTDVSCTYIPQNKTCHDKIPDQEPCWETGGLRRLDAYRIFLTLFVMTLGPFAFFNVQKTKYLQILTTMMRWLAFTIMIIYASKKLIIDGPQGTPALANTAGMF